MSIVYLNGEFMPASNASISPLDRGFLFADGVYEVIPVYQGRLLRLEDHLQRLDHSLEGIRLEKPLDRLQWKTILTELVYKNGGGDMSIYLQITRGVAARDHAFPTDITPTVFVMTNPLKPVADDILKRGISAICVDDIRWKYCHIKSIALLPNILLRQQAVDKGAMEAILVRDGLITEGAASNVFVVKENILTTPPKGPFLLPGITRDLVIELAKVNDISVLETDISLYDLQTADEIWLTSSTREVIPVTLLDGKPVDSGAPGAMWSKIAQLYRSYKQDIITSVETV